MTDVETTAPGRAPAAAAHGWRWLAALEVALAALAVVLDLFVPSLVLLVLAGASLLARRAGPASLGLSRWRARRLVPKMLAFAAAWSLFQLAVTMPVANHVSGRRADLAQFDDLEGDLGLLLLFLVLGWTLAAFGEELAFRGFLLTRARQTFGSGRPALVAAVLLSSVLFALLHTEQGVAGVVVVALDAIAWSVLRLRYDTLWAPVLAHGFNNTLGFLTFFLVGPVYGFW